MRPSLHAHHQAGTLCIVERTGAVPDGPTDRQRQHASTMRLGHKARTGSRVLGVVA